jgi:hypothetical protein
MRNRLATTTVLIVLSLSLAGCESKSPFADQAEELAYLQALGNPTPEQFKRRGELTKVKQAQAKVTETKAKAQADQEREKHFQKLVKLARGAYETSNWADAVYYFGELVEQFPDRAGVKEFAAKRDEARAKETAEIDALRNESNPKVH